MKQPLAFETLYNQERGERLHLPPPLDLLLGEFRMPLESHPPYLIGNFVSTLDGVVSLDEAGHEGGGPISGFHPSDQALMGVLRAIADAIIVGSRTLHEEPTHKWTAEYIYPDLADTYQELRRSLGKSERPLNVLVSTSGNLDLSLNLFQEGTIPVLIVTSTEGEKRLHKQTIPPSVQIKACTSEGGMISASNILHAVQEKQSGTLYLTEGGPGMLTTFLRDGSLDELFLTLAPQLAGHMPGDTRPSIAMGHHFAPDQPLWSDLLSVKRVESHLFLRYAFRKR
ncbi:RibD family protein [Ktedonospora formicarum]|uniref:Bacterial bifunctional deaminase-reductase C-terminal domain-containing protein n=1 Tax=Ktedonospora formicarum TaxID=2778364 RepID=A0A8J3HZU3_9CHLR|nr:dihydrofolate reductase family protein [Ktedonospora formicarum]GHO45016.1 hypothetical protein KSX_31790 [Ktedonospora formicarum]